MWLPSELAAFAQVVELGSFTACARALGVPKVAVSRAIQSLEKRAGTRLLTRTTRRIALTDAGRALLPHAQRLAADLVRHAVLVPGQQVSELRLHRGKTQAQIALTPRLVVTDPWVVHAATAAGAGIGVLPEFLCRQGLAMNKLERVLPDWQVADLLEFHAVTDLRRASTPAVRALIDFFVANIVPVLGRG